MRFNQLSTRNVQKGIREEEEEEVRAKVRAKGRQQEYER